MKTESEIRLPERIGYVCIEGVIGVGKTSLSKLLTSRLDARLVLEAHDENPFLGKFYANRKSYAFQTQVWFLLSRFRQLSETFVQQDLFHRITIADYMFAKDRIFASLNLDENELSLYDTIAGALEGKIPKIDFVIYLQASTETLLRRIAERGRTYEERMDQNYIDALNQAYNHYFFHYTDTPVLIINCNDIDFVNNPGDFEEILRQIQQAKPGSNYYHPLGNAQIDEKGKIR